MSKAVMQQALSAFEEIMFTKNVGSSHIIAKNARYALREELAQPEQEPVANSDLYSISGRLALELECLLLDTKDISIVSKWWDSAHEALDQWRKFHLRACTELDSDEITKSCDSKPESDAMRLYQAVDRLATQAGEDAGETIDWLCGEHGGMSKLFEAYFSPKPIANPLANQSVASGSLTDSSTNIAGSSIDLIDSATRSADSAETFGKPEQPDLRKAAEMVLEALEKADFIVDMADAHYGIEPEDRLLLIETLRQALARPEQELDYPPECTTPELEVAYAAGWWKALEVQRNKQQALDKKADNARELGLDYESDHSFDRTASHMAGEYVDTAEQEPVAWLTKDVMANYLDLIAQAIADNNAEMLQHSAHWLRKGEI